MTQIAHDTNPFITRLQRPDLDLKNEQFFEMHGTYMFLFGCKDSAFPGIIVPLIESLKRLYYKRILLGTHPYTGTQIYKKRNRESLTHRNRQTY